MLNAKKLLKQALKQAGKRLGRAELEAKVVDQLIANGKSRKKATAIVAAKLALPCFVVDGSTVTLRPKGAPDEEPAAAASTSSKRTTEAPIETPPAKKRNTATKDAKPSTETGTGASALGKVRMMDAHAADAFWKEHRIEVTGDAAAAFRPCASFEDAGFSTTVLRTVKSFSRPTPIQSACWPIMMAGRDVIGVAETGSGKTLAFFLPAMMHCAAHAPPQSGPQVLILAPTRELAMQTEDVCRAAGAEASLKSICIYGGVPKGPQRQAVRDGARVVVATPGRLLDLHEEGGVSLAGVSYLVLDEADRMLDMGFHEVFGHSRQGGWWLTVSK